MGFCSPTGPMKHVWENGEVNRITASHLIYSLKTLKSLEMVRIQGPNFYLLMKDPNHPKIILFGYSLHDQICYIYIQKSKGP